MSSRSSRRTARPRASTKPRFRPLSEVLAGKDVISAAPDGSHIVVRQSPSRQFQEPDREKPRQRDFRELGSTGTTSWQYYDRFEYLAELRGHEAYRTLDKMRRGDGQVRKTLRLIKTPVVSGKWLVKPASDDPQDEEVAEFVWACFNEFMSSTFRQVLTDALLMLDYGHAVLEKVWETRTTRFGRKHVWKKLAPRHPADEYQWEFDRHGGPNGVWMWLPERSVGALGVIPRPRTTVPPGGEPYVWLPIRKILVFTNDKEVGNIIGMALALDTPVPTPNGVKKMESLRIGDPVYDETGRVRYVTGERTWTDRPTYRVKFSDGSHIDADRNHLWSVLARDGSSTKRVPQVVPTWLMANNVKYKDTARYAIEKTQPVYMPEAELPIDPYVLGWWISDGTKLTAEVTSKDPETKFLIEQCGYSLTEKRMPREYAMTYRVSGLQLQLRALNLVGNKHIPEMFHKASVEQRLALVQGLMDGDGTINRFGQCEFANTNEVIVDGMVRLLSSLGIISKVQWVPPSGNRKLDIARVKFTSDLPVFRLPRKLEKWQRRMDSISSKGRRSYYHYVTSVEYIGEQTTKCIEVDSPSHLYLAGASYVPTHNSILRSAYKHWYMKDKLYLIDAIQKERHGIGIPIIQLPTAFNEEDRRLADEIGRNLRVNESAHVVLPPNWILEYAEISGNPVDCLTSIEHHNDMISATILGDFLGPRGESNEISRDIFLQSARFVADAISDTFNRYAIPQLVDFNYSVEQYPRLMVRHIGDTVDQQKFSFGVRNLVGADLLRADDPLEDYLRELWELPARDPESDRKLEQQEFEAEQAMQQAELEAEQAEADRKAGLQQAKLRTSSGPTGGQQRGARAGLPRQGKPSARPPGQNAGKPSNNPATTRSSPR